MRRTTINLPDVLKRRSMDKARAAGLSFAEFVRKAVEQAVNESPSQTSQRQRLAALADLRSFRQEAATDGPADLAKNLDDYLYGTTAVPVTGLDAKKTNP